MLWLGIFIAFTGFLFLLLGLYLRKSAADPKAKKKKKVKKQSEANPTTFIVGGLLTVAAGVGMAVFDLVRST